MASLGVGAFGIETHGIGDLGRYQAPLASCGRNRLILATDETVQIHGGIGMTDQLAIGLFVKRARVAAMLLGDGDFQAEKVARLRGF